MGWEFTYAWFFCVFPRLLCGNPQWDLCRPKTGRRRLKRTQLFTLSWLQTIYTNPYTVFTRELEALQFEEFTSEAFTYHRRLSNVIQNLFKPRSLTQLFFPGISRIRTLSMKPFLFDTPLVFQPNDHTMFDELFLGIVMRITINLSCFLAFGFRCCVLRLFSNFLEKGRSSTILFTQHPLRITPKCKDSPRQRWSKKSPRKIEDQLPSNFPTTNNVRE